MDILYKDALKLKRPNAFHVMLKPAGPSYNLNCTYCYYLEKNRLYPGRKDLRMSDELLENFTRQFIGANEVPVVTFTWQGGEPLMVQGITMIIIVRHFSGELRGMIHVHAEAERNSRIIVQGDQLHYRRRKHSGQNKFMKV